MWFRSSFCLHDPSSQEAYLNWKGKEASKAFISMIMAHSRSLSKIDGEVHQPRCCEGAVTSSSLLHDRTRWAIVTSLRLIWKADEMRNNWVLSHQNEWIWCWFSNLINTGGRYFFYIQEIPGCNVLNHWNLRFATSERKMHSWLEGIAGLFYGRILARIPRIIEIANLKAFLR